MSRFNYRTERSPPENQHDYAIGDMPIYSDETKKRMNMERKEALRRQMQRCPFCNTEKSLLEWNRCRCLQHDFICDCGRSFHVCKLDNTIQSGHPCIRCQNGTVSGAIPFD